MRFHIEEDVLMIQLEGLEQVWALKRRLAVRKADIKQAVWQEGVTIPHRELMWRVGGAGVPGVLAAGRFAGSDGLNFVYLRRPLYRWGSIAAAHVLTIELRRGRYRRLILTVDKPDIAEQIISWWSSNV